MARIISPARCSTQRHPSNARSTTWILNNPEPPRSAQLDLNGCDSLARIGTSDLIAALDTRSSGAHFSPLSLPLRRRRENHPRRTSAGEVLTSSRLPNSEDATSCLEHHKSLGREIAKDRGIGSRAHVGYHTAAEALLYRAIVGDKTPIVEQIRARTKVEEHG